MKTVEPTLWTELVNPELASNVSKRELTRQEILYVDRLTALAAIYSCGSLHRWEVVASEERYSAHDCPLTPLNLTRDPQVLSGIVLDCNALRQAPSPSEPRDRRRGSTAARPPINLPFHLIGAPHSVEIPVRLLSSAT